MRRSLLALAATLTVLGGSLFVAGGPAAAGGACSAGLVEVRGRVRDAATTLPLDEVTSVGVFLAGSPIDGLGTDPGTSRWSTCLVPGEYTFDFTADSYRHEFFHDAPDAVSATPVTVALPGPTVVNESLVPKGRVLAGVVTNAAGQPKPASVGIWRLTSVGWRPVDGIGNDMPSGRWSFRVPFVGRYRVMAEVDHHWSEFWNDKPRLSLATTINVTSATTFIDGIDLRLTYCTASTPDFCRPPGFTS
ncbi:MAG: hypothetical protein JNK12_23250 [Acidimicrobiales bacterium]|nr:hypothetical protein [Acidimicrobiales bacterium]